MSSFHPFEDLVEKKNKIQTDLEDERINRKKFLNLIIKLMFELGLGDVAQRINEIYERTFDAAEQNKKKY